jgi:DNA-binding response OmpR family regulator
MTNEHRGAGLTHRTDADEANLPSLVYVIEDDPAVARLVLATLAEFGFNGEGFSTGASVLRRLQVEKPDLCIIDLGLPDMDGIDLMRRIQAASSAGVLILTGRGHPADRVMGLELGGDDYVTKPFSPAELVARVKAVLRRADGGAAPEVVQVGPVVVDLARREVLVHDAPVELTTKEFELLRFLAERPGLALSRQQILDGVWGPDWYGDARTVDVHIAQVRKKLGDALTITTVRSIGYRLESPRRAAP